MFNDIVQGILVSDAQVHLGNNSNHDIEYSGNIFKLIIDFKELKIENDYPNHIFSNATPVRRIKQISVTIPTLLGPYQDIQAILSYEKGDDVEANSGLHSSCNQIAISTGAYDNGLFELNFNDSKYLPFEGLNINEGQLILKLPNVEGDDQGPGNTQYQILDNLNDVILHISDTIIVG